MCERGFRATYKINDVTRCSVGGLVTIYQNIYLEYIIDDFPDGVGLEEGFQSYIEAKVS